MKSLDLRRYALTSCVAGAMLAGCAGSRLSVGSPDTGPARLQERAALTASTEAAPTSDSKSGGYKVTPPLLFVTNVTQADNDVKIYRATAKDPSPLAVILDKISTPNGACVDSKGTLYVTNEPSSGSGWISEYALGKTVASKVVTEGVNTPAFCAIDANGNLWVTNLGLNDVAEYLPGASKPHITITKDVYYPLGIAIDHAANLYVVNGFGSSNRNIEVYAPGSSSPSRTITDGITWPDGIAVDSNGTLYVTNIATENVEEYRFGQDSPFQTITHDMHQPVDVTVNKKGVLYVANLASDSNTVLEFRLGSLTPLKRRVSKDLYNPQGLAYYPPVLP